MKIAIASTSPETDSQVSMQGARAAHYLIYDTQSSSLDAVCNPAANAERGAGPQAAAYLVGRGVDRVIAGQFGSRFRIELENSGIEAVEKTGKISEILIELCKIT